MISVGVGVGEGKGRYCSAEKGERFVGSKGED